MCYQEDVSKTAMALAGFDAAEADGLRKILSKKSKRRLPEYREKFFQGALERGVSQDTIEKIWDMIMSFSGYSFCKPHSASYAQVSFKSAWLKTHYPAEFMAAVISNQGGYYHAFAYVSECKRMGLRVLLPCVNESGRPYLGAADWVRIGLMQVKGLSDAAMGAVVEGRKRGPYRDLDDFLSRAEIDPSDARLLVKAGCFDALRLAQGGVSLSNPAASGNMTRPEMMWRIHERTAGKGRGGNAQRDLFDDEPREDPAAAAEAPLRRGEGPPPTEEYSDSSMIKHEIQTLGFLASRHPLELYRDKLAKIRRVEAKDMAKHKGRRIAMIGWYVTGKMVSAKGGEPMEFMSFEDTTDIYEAVFFPRAYAKFCSKITRQRPYVLKGTVDEDFGTLSLNVDDVAML